MNFYEEIDRVFHDWNYNHPRILHSLVRALKPSVIVEVGTYRGYAACWMAQALKENNGDGHLYCIDDFSETIQKPYDENHWHTNLVTMEVRKFVTLLRGRSDQVQWPHSVDMAYIDGWHGFSACMADFFMCDARGAKVIALDDTVSTIGPRRVVQAIRKDRASVWDVVEFYSDCGLALCVRKREKPRFTFSQELPNIPGVDLRECSDEQVKEHLAAAASENGIDYGRYPL